jgi:subtilisin-like proprotein convertase family protein
MAVTVDATKGPLTVTSQATTGISWTQGSSQTITWTVNSTNTLTGGGTVDILLSTDGGQTYPTVLASNVTNNGTATITVPNIAAPYCRVMVKANGNIFFNVNTKDFAIGYVVTTTCNTYSNTTPLTIPDGTGSNIAGATVSNTINVPVTGNISDVNITINGSHTYFWDLVTAVNHPDGTQARMLNRNCNNVSTGFNIIFNDGAPAIVCSANVNGTYAPANPLSAYNNKPANGVWTLLANDNWNGDTGQINSWSIEICTLTATLATDSFGLQDFSLYPNPNNGNFNIQFTSNSSNEIKVGVHDLRGRLVFEKEYQNTGTFNQNLQLNNVQTGIYMVTVQDGERKETKKIVIE